MELNLDDVAALSAQAAEEQAEKERRRILRGRFALCRGRYHMADGTVTFKRVGPRASSPEAAIQAAGYEPYQIGTPIAHGLTVCVRYKGDWHPYPM